MKITLDLSGHCIETALKRVHNRAVSACLSPRGNPESHESTLELARRCLEGLDFSRLRGEYPALAGHHCQRVELLLEEDRVRIDLDGRPLAAVALPPAAPP